MTQCVRMAKFWIFSSYRSMHVVNICCVTSSLSWTRSSARPLPNKRSQAHLKLKQQHIRSTHTQEWKMWKMTTLEASSGQSVSQPASLDACRNFVRLPFTTTQHYVSRKRIHTIQITGAQVRTNDEETKKHDLARHSIFDC